MQQTRISPFTIFYENSEEFYHLKNEVFTQGIYYFETSAAQPRIIDAGAHIGLATLYFKKLYPNAKITAIEPLPENFALLKKNVFENQLHDVEIHQVALADHSGTADFFFDETAEKWLSTAGFTSGAWNHQQKSQRATVETKTLTDFLTEPIDFLKMDIEGAEQHVLLAARKKIHLIKQMIIEFHPTAQQSLQQLVYFLEQHAFRIDLWQNGQKIKLQTPKKLLYIEARKK